MSRVVESQVHVKVDRHCTCSGERGLDQDGDILIVHASAELYGSDRACVTVARAAVSDGLDTTVLIPVEGPLRTVLESVGARVHVLDTLVLRMAELRGMRVASTVLTWPRAIVELRRFASRHRFALVHSNCAPTLGGALLARWWNVPHVWHVHELVRDKPVMRLVFEQFLRAADVVLASSVSIREQFKSPSIRSRCVVAYTGGEVPRTIRPSVPLARAYINLICVGRLSERKGQHLLIQAVSVLRQNGYDIRLTLVGEVFGSEYRHRDQLERLSSRLQLDDVVSFLGERTDAVKMIASADILVMPSIRPEAFGIVVIEGMALGRPVIASDTGGPGEIITNGYDGVLVAPNEVGELVDAIQMLVDEPEWARELAERGKHTAAQFSPDALAMTTLTVYRRLLSAAVGETWHDECGDHL